MPTQHNCTRKTYQNQNAKNISQFQILLQNYPIISLQKKIPLQIDIWLTFIFIFMNDSPNMKLFRYRSWTHFLFHGYETIIFCLDSYISQKIWELHLCWPCKLGVSTNYNFGHHHQKAIGFVLQSIWLTQRLECVLCLCGTSISTTDTYIHLSVSERTYLHVSCENLPLSLPALKPCSHLIPSF